MTMEWRMAVTQGRDGSPVHSSRPRIRRARAGRGAVAALAASLAIGACSGTES